MPPPGPNGEIDPSLAPEFIAVAGRDGGIVGYTPKKYLLPGSTTTLQPVVDAEIPVFGDDLLTPIGHLVPGKGFVPQGVDPGTIPNIPVQVRPSFATPSGEPKSLTMYVRSAAAGTVWFAEGLDGVIVSAQGGYFHGLGVGCTVLTAGSQLVMVDRPPMDPGSRTLRVIYQAARASETPTLWVDIGNDGAVSQGQGVPSWWPGPPQEC